MCSHYESLVNPTLLRTHFGVHHDPEALRSDMWPRYMGLFVRSHPFKHVGDEAVPEREAVVGRWGLIPFQTKVPNEKLSTFNAKAETAAKLFTFRNAWSRAQFCIIPATAIYEPDWRSGKAVATRFTRTDGKPMGIAGLWDQWKSPEGRLVESYTMLTISAQEHPLFKHYHRPEKEKRQVVILLTEDYSAWLECQPQDAMRFLRGYPADALNAEPLR